jgi:hypothetical protein
MRNCSYCGRENSDEGLNCHECGGTDFGTQIAKAVTLPSKFLLAIRRFVSLIIGTLMFLVVVPEFAGMPRGWILFWTAFPLAPVLFVCFGAGRNRFVEAVGWVLQALGVVMFLSV